MNRRNFVVGAIVATVLGGGVLGYREYARASMKSKLLNDAIPPLTSITSTQLNALPERAREEIKRYFDGACLNAQGFVSHICSQEFREVLGSCKDDHEREVAFLAAFCSRVATSAEILNHVELIAAEIGTELDSAWSGYCNAISSKWNTHLDRYGEPLSANGLVEQLSGLIRNELAQAVKESSKSNLAPAIGDTIGKIGESAVMLLPVARYPNLFVPLFVVLAAKSIWDFIWGQFHDPQNDLQAMISGRLALLGKRVGAEFEREVRQRLTDLHTWQEKSIRALASRLVDERI
jgi:hypothetical protein